MASSMTLIADDSVARDSVGHNKNVMARENRKNMDIL